MKRFDELQKTETNAHHKRIFEILAKRESPAADCTSDGYGQIVLDSGELDSIKNELSDCVQENRGNVQTAEQMKAALLAKMPERINAAMRERQNAANFPDSAGIVKDGYENNISGIGTAIDPGMNTESFIPVSILPSEATAYYSSGGIPARVINKKAGCLSLDGLHFECSDFTGDDIKRLEDYAAKTGFDEAYSDAITQSLIFGGAVCYPSFFGDTPLLSQYSMSQIKQRFANEKDFINYWITADRWNCVFVPEYNITAQDYLFAKSLFIPLGGVRVNTDRMALVRPAKLPFWGAIQQMGWATSDFEGWIKDFESYQIMKMSLPIMAQQSSLMYHSIPADGIIVENGAEYSRQFFKENEKQMRDWSILHPRAINSIGEIKILERTYTGFHDLINESRIALCASCSIPESILFAEKSTGLASDNEQDVTLKQSENIRLLFNNVAPSFAPCIELLVYSCFGVNSEQAQFARNVKIKKDMGVILSDTDKAQLGQAFATIAGQMSAIGAPIHSAIEIARKFIPSELVDDKALEALQDVEPGGFDEGLWDMLTANRG